MGKIYLACFCAAVALIAAGFALLALTPPSAPIVTANPTAAVERPAVLDEPTATATTPVDASPASVEDEPTATATPPAGDGAAELETVSAARALVLPTATASAPRPDGPASARTVDGPAPSAPVSAGSPARTVAPSTEPVRSPTSTPTIPARRTAVPTPTRTPTKAAPSPTPSPTPTPVSPLATAAIGHAAPDWELPLVDGQRLSLSALRHSTSPDAPVVLDISATWCPPCKLLGEHLRTLQPKYAQAGVRFVTIDLQEPPQVVADYVKANGFSWPFVIDQTGRVAAQYGTTSLPKIWFINRQGILVDTVNGAISTDDLDRRIQQLLPPPPGTAG